MEDIEMSMAADLAEMRGRPDHPLLLEYRRVEGMGTYGGEVHAALLESFLWQASDKMQLFPYVGPNGVLTLRRHLIWHVGVAPARHIWRCLVGDYE